MSVTDRSPPIADVPDAGAVDHRHDAAADVRRDLGQEPGALGRVRVLDAAPQGRVVLGRAGMGLEHA
jgi:hypothetical protein